MHTCTSIWPSRNERKMLFWLISIGNFFFFLESVSVGHVVVLTCTCEICITFFAAGCGADVPSLCVVQPCFVPSGTHLELPVPLDVLLRGDACPWDRDSSVGGSPTCLAPPAVLLSPPSFSSLGLVVVPGLQGDSQGPNWLPMCLMSVNGGCNFVALSAPVRMSARILNNHLDVGNLENVRAQSVVVLVLDTPTAGWLTASPGGWAVSRPHSSGAAGSALGFSAQRSVEAMQITSCVNMKFFTCKWKRPL